MVYFLIGCGELVMWAGMGKAGTGHVARAIGGLIVYVGFRQWDGHSA